MRNSHGRLSIDYIICVKNELKNQDLTLNYAQIVESGRPPIEKPFGFSWNNHNSKINFRVGFSSRVLHGHPNTILRVTPII